MGVIIRMKTGVKKYLVLMLSLVITAIAWFTAFAEDTDVPTAFTIELSDGTVNEYDMTFDFVKTVNSAPDGSIVTLAANTYIASRINVYGTEDEPKSITINLAGYGIYVTSKNSASTMFSTGNYATLNVTSSEPDAFLYMIDESSNSTQGGNIFSVNGIGAVTNLGGAVSLKGETYPGANISTFSSCFVDVRGEQTVGFNCDGGRHFANIADWKGFINPRSGSGTVTIKNADILIDRNNNLIHSEDANSTLYMENCLIFRLDGTPKAMFNDVHADITFKNCKTNYSLVADGTFRDCIVNLEGENIFGAELGFNYQLLKNGEEKTAARTNTDCVLSQGGSEYWRYDNSGMFKKLYESLSGFGEAFAIVESERTYKCVWEYDGTSKTEIWAEGAEPVPPFEILPSGKDGMYKKGWLKIRDSENEITYKSTYIVDFDIKVQCEYEYDLLSYRIYVPAFVVDDGYISFAEGKIDGSGFMSADWAKKTIDGESYYEYVTMNMDEDDIDKMVEISLPCDFIDGSKRIKADGVWRINLSKYLRIVDENAENYTQDQMKLVWELRDRYFPSSDSDA